MLQEWVSGHCKVRRCWGASTGVEVVVATRGLSPIYAACSFNFRKQECLFIKMWNNNFSSAHFPWSK